MKHALVLALIAGAAVSAGADEASAQANRTWVSGLGSNSNPCTRSSPCQTFAGAYAKTNAGGEIDVLDPGDFGTLIITHAITIDGQGQLASILTPGDPMFSAFYINAGPSDVVILRNLTINGEGQGGIGIVFNTGAALHIHNCVIMNATSGTQGLKFSPNAASMLFIQDTVITNNAGGGLLVAPVSGGSAKVALSRVRLNGNGPYGLRGDTTGSGSGTVNVAVTDSEIAGNAGDGVEGASGSSTVIVVINRSDIVHNAVSGISANGSNVYLLAGGSTFDGNTYASFGYGTYTYQNNSSNGNSGSNGVFINTLTLR